jgi:coproporphyrinogen III oxidase
LQKFASWEYNFKTKPNSDEAKTTSLLKKEINWI